MHVTRIFWLEGLAPNKKPTRGRQIKVVTFFKIGKNIVKVTPLERMLVSRKFQIVKSLPLQELVIPEKQETPICKHSVSETRWELETSTRSLIHSAN